MADVDVALKETFAEVFAQAAGTARRPALAAHPAS